MAVNGFVTLGGVELQVELPLTTNYQEITGDDGRDIIGELRITHRAWKRKWSLRDGLADEATKQTWEALALNVQPIAFIDEVGVTHSVKTRNPSFSLRARRDASNTLWECVLELEEV